MVDPDRIVAAARRRAQLEDELVRLRGVERAYGLRRRARVFASSAGALVVLAALAALFVEEAGFLLVAALEVTVVLAVVAFAFVAAGRRARVQRLLIEAVLEGAQRPGGGQTETGAAAPTGASSSSADQTTS